LYERWPSTLIALTALGTCMMSPVRSASPARTAASVTAPAGAPPVVSPSASSVTVAWPSRIVAAYALSLPLT
jgi:hypothetical protein